MANPCPILVMAAVLTLKVLLTAPGSGTKSVPERSSAGGLDTAVFETKILSVPPLLRTPGDVEMLC